MGEVASEKSTIGLAMAGGAPEGAVYEIGVLRALDDAIEGLDFNNLCAYVGISAGAFINASLVNKVTTAQLVRALLNIDPNEQPFDPGMFLSPAFSQYLKSGLMVPRLLMEAARDYLIYKEDHTIVKSLTRLSRALPVGLFDNEPLRRYLERVFNRPERTDDFRKLDNKLFVVAVELDTGQAVVFGQPGKDHVPISRAVQASTALPGLYPPVKIDGKNYVDGVLRRTLHASTVLDEGAKLVICINPIVPVDTGRAVEEGFLREPNLTERGMPSILSQTFRTLIYSRMKVGFRRYDKHYEDTDLVLFEPSPDDYRMFFTNIFSFAKRKVVAEHAYTNTIRDLANRADELTPIFEKHGLKLRHEVIFHPEPNLWRSVGVADPTTKKKTRRRHRVTNNLNDALAHLEAVIAAKKAARATQEAQAKQQEQQEQTEQPVG
ncbi:patatin-like phospholipase family protein [Acanthopleuribacter pedis]|uniref:Patatin-like phospholipase family protein n=1 Tax=Acanthopleuribacter pedis TaxID=442870 RepID=A0A8J7U3E5_9BACT|nr:patatin-like phospholipase family protein [Acanthopleuribacter pedis]MBO1319547.1 patatin-like phospholipase family protein [Acanthopleuribacter pedis]